MATLTTKNGTIALIDDEDIDLQMYHWHDTKQIYLARDVMRKRKNTRILLHRLILSRELGRPLVPGERCDHIDGNRLNNQRYNLRLATHAENQRNVKLCKRNTSGYKGVSKHKDRWVAQICYNRKRMYLGLFDTPEEAAKAYAAAAHRYHGEFVRKDTVYA